MLTAIVADDLTGAADTGMQFARAGYRTTVVFRDAKMNLGDFDAVAFDTDSRTAPPGSAAERTADAMHVARYAHIVYKKLDSTLRGNVAAELAAALETSGREHAVVAPAFPDAGRTTVDGVQRLNGVPVHETKMAKDPGMPITDGYLPTLLSGKFAEIGMLETGDLQNSATVRRRLERSRCIVADAESNADLDALVRAAPDASQILWAGSAGLAKALAGQHPGPHAGEERAAPAIRRGVLVVIGSLSGSSREQLRRLVDERDAVAVCVAGCEDVDEAVAAARTALEDNECAILHSPERRTPTRNTPIVSLLAQCAASLSARELFGALVMTGGSTAVAVSRRLGASGIMLEGEVETGVPVGTLICPKPYRVVTKAGGFGNPNTLLRAVELLESEE